MRLKERKRWKRKRSSGERQIGRKRMQRHNLIMSFWAIFSPASHIATGRRGTGRKTAITAKLRGGEMKK